MSNDANVEVKIYVAKIADLIANDANPRKIDRKAYDKLKKSLQDFPEMKQLREIVVDENMVILGGHQRIYALKDLGYEDVTVKQVFGLTEKQKREFIIKDNASAGTWDTDIIANMWDVDEMDQWGIDLSKFMDTGFGDDFDLKDGDKEPFGQMTFMLADPQIEVIKQALKMGKDLEGETYGNENGNGNALFWIVEQWLAQNKLS